MIRKALVVGILSFYSAPLTAQDATSSDTPPADGPPALQDNGLRPADTKRLVSFDAAAGKALKQALATGSRGDVDMLQEVMAGTPVSPISTTLPGEWKCRMLKLGGDLNGLVVYAPFACTMTAEGPEFDLTKTSGSQRLNGRISLIDGQMVLTGTGYVEGTDPLPYKDLPADLQSDGTQWPIVGVVEQVSTDRVRILMPNPVLESDFNILDLRRVPAPEIEQIPDAEPAN